MARLVLAGRPLMIQRLFYKLCKRLDLSLLYQSSFGIKGTNQLIHSDRFRFFVRGEMFQLPADQLRLGFDGLKDTHTLLGETIVASPQFELVERFQTGKDVASSRYAARSSQGMLDFRPARKWNKGFEQQLKDKCDRTLAAVRATEVEPIKTITIRGSYYIADGKHRAAVCAWAGQMCPCLDASLILHDSFYWWVYRKMKRHAVRFQRHIQWFESFISVD